MLLKKMKLAMLVSLVINAVIQTVNSSKEQFVGKLLYIFYINLVFQNRPFLDIKYEL